MRRQLALLVVTIALFGTVLYDAPGAAPARPEQAAPPITVESFSVILVDTARTTVAHGGLPEQPSRTLPTIVWYPVQQGKRLGQAPLIVFAHGVSANATIYTTFARQLAAAGYVVAAPTFPLTHGGTPGGLVFGDVVNQPGDMSFVITQMLAMNKDKSSPLYHRVRANRIGVGGHSYGGFTTLGFYNTCCLDPRVDAAVSVAGAQPTYPGSYHFEAGPPLLLLHGTDDSVVSYQNSVSAYANAAPPKFFVTLIGGEHIPFRLGVNPPLPVPPSETVSINSIVDFYDRYLKNDRQALDALRDDANVPGVASLQEQVR